MKSLFASIALIATAQIALVQSTMAEVKPAGTVLSRICGTVDRGANVITIEQTPKAVCLSSIQDVPGDFVVVQPNLGPSDVYAVVAKDSETFGDESVLRTEHQLVHIGVLGPKGRVVRQEPYGVVFAKAQISSIQSGESMQIVKVALATEGSHTVQVSNLKVMFHTMWYLPTI